MQSVELRLLPMIRFTIEQRHLTDDHGKPMAPPPAAFHTCEAENVNEALRLFVKKRPGAEIIGDVLTFPGFQAVATVRKASGVYTLQFTPASQRDWKL